MRLYRTIVLLVICLFTASGAYAAGPDDARQFVDSVGQRVMGVVNAGGSEDQRHAQLQQMFSDSVDIDWMAKFVLGRGWQQASQDQRSHYLQAYRQYLLTRYTTNFADYTGSKYTITDVKSEEAGQYTVTMQIKTPAQGQQDVVAGYRVRTSENGQFKIIDIIVEGVSLITTERSEFSSVLQQKGMDGLIGAIETKTGNENGSKKSSK